MISTPSFLPSPLTSSLFFANSNTTTNTNNNMIVNTSINEEAIIQSYRDDNHNDNDDRMVRLSVPDPILRGTAMTPIAKYSPDDDSKEKEENENVDEVIKIRRQHLKDPCEDRVRSLSRSSILFSDIKLKNRVIAPSTNNNSNSTSNNSNSNSNPTVQSPFGRRRNSIGGGNDNVLAQKKFREKWGCWRGG
eukprot:gene7934-16250_t